MKDPTTLDEAVDCLIAHMTEADKKAYANGSPAPHFTLGTNMRNDWGLWHDSPLATFFKSNGIYHADDMSGTIFDCLRARLKSELFDIKERADYYRNWWKKRYGLDHTQFGKPEPEDRS